MRQGGPRQLPDFRYCTPRFNQLNLKLLRNDQSSNKKRDMKLVLIERKTQISWSQLQMMTLA
ncbi:hypothetical protein DPV78_001679 [Talaromyces pinophilus]|nr:hypothetical protein DPV78_001679 [Talaromyces pinophilus]